MCRGRCAGLSDRRVWGAVLALHGVLARRSAPSLHQTLTKLVLDRGRVFVDVCELSVAWEPALAIFPTVLAQAGGWPLARLVLVGPDRSVDRALRASRVAEAVQVAPDWSAAHELVELRPSLVSRWREIAPSSDTGIVARAAARDVCEDWQLVELAIPAAVVATELVVNAVRHARTPCRLTFTLHRSGLRISVRDGRLAAEAELAVSRGEPECCTGLAVVHSLARRWGVLSHTTGKTVWALLAA